MFFKSFNPFCYILPCVLTLFNLILLLKLLLGQLPLFLHESFNIITSFLYLHINFSQLFIQNFTFWDYSFVLSLDSFNLLKGIFVLKFQVNLGLEKIILLVI